ncbi:MAG: hypothetical protein HN849_02500 [Victivallales bacterium]|jgi:hypothetical protein|nr:hypothetical protein [Victivallales bacterium]
MAIRLQLLLIIGGGVLAFFGFQEYRVGAGAAAQPVAVELAELEAGEELPNVHAKIGEHLCLYSAAVYRCNVGKGEGQPGPDSKIDYMYFPIISTTHAWFSDANAVLAQHGGNAAAVPEKGWPEVKPLAVLVKSKDRFGTVGEIPDEWVVRKEVSGLVVNRIKKLSGEERDLIQRSFPSADLDKILILADGRSPRSGAATMGIIGGGILLALAGLGWMVARARG